MRLVTLIVFVLQLGLVIIHSASRRERTKIHVNDADFLFLAQTQLTKGLKWTVQL
jgi:hypothetical protein